VKFKEEPAAPPVDAIPDKLPSTSEPAGTDSPFSFGLPSDLIGQEQPGLPSNFLNQPAPVQEEQRDPALQALEEKLVQSKKVGDFLLGHEEEEMQKVTVLAKEFGQTYARPPPKESRCRTEHDDCLRCYKENPQNPLKCASVVNAFTACAQRTYEDYAALG